MEVELEVVEESEGIKDTDETEDILEELKVEPADRYSFIKTVEEDVDFVSCTEVENIIKSNRFISALSTDDILYKLLVKVMNEGTFIRYAVGERDLGYALPGTNAGVVIRSGESYLEETVSFLKGVLSQAVPDVIVDTFDEGYKDIYVMTKLINSILIDVLVEYVYVNKFKSLGLFTLEELDSLETSEIYNYFKDRDISLETAVKEYTEYVLNNITKQTNYMDKAAFYFQEYDFKQKLGDRYLDWSKYAATECVKCGFNYCTLSGFNSLIGLELKELVNILFGYSLVTLYFALHQRGESLSDLADREKLALKQINMFTNLKNFVKDDDMFIDLSDCRSSLGLSVIIAHQELGVSEISEQYRKDVEKLFCIEV